MFGTLVKRDPVVLGVKKQDFPELSKQNCKICQVGTFEKKLTEYKREVDYQEAWITVFIRNLPAAVCTNCGCEIVLNRLLDALDLIVMAFLEANLNEKDLSTVDFDKSLVELVS